MDQIIKNPRVTEKASLLAGANVYSFDVDESANKVTIWQAIFNLYKVKPVRVHVISIPRKHVLYKGKKGTKGGGKKALVYLKKGDKIEFM